MSIAVRMQLAAELVRLRLAAGKSEADVAESKIMVVETLQSIERAKRPIKPVYVGSLCRLYEADAATTEQLMTMAMNKEKGWWEGAASIRLHPKFKFFIQAESAAYEVFTYDSELLYGLLQTQHYHEEVYRNDPTLPPDKLDREIEFRDARRKAALGRTPPLCITTVLNPAILRRRFSGLDEQIEHLRRMNREPHVDLSVLPEEAGMHAVMSGSIKILTFNLPGVPPVAYEENVGGVHYTEDDDTVELYRTKFRHVRQKAVSLEEYLR